MTDGMWSTKEKEASENEVAIDYIKGSDFRLSWIDGALGSITPSNKVQMTLYAERPAIPQRQVFKIDKDSSELGVEIFEKRISRESIIREMSVNILMTAETAESLGKFLIKLSKDLESKENEER